MFIARAPNNDLVEGAFVRRPYKHVAPPERNGDAGSSAARRQPAAWSRVSNNLANAYNIHA
jgi:hypothetical protein